MIFNKGKVWTAIVYWISVLLIYFLLLFAGFVSESLLHHLITGEELMYWAGTISGLVFMAFYAMLGSAVGVALMIILGVVCKINRDRVEHVVFSYSISLFVLGWIFYDDGLPSFLVVLFVLTLAFWGLYSGLVLRFFRN